MIEVAKITEEIAEQISGQLSLDEVRNFNPVQDANGNWIMDLQMAIDNDIPHEIIIFVPIPDES